MYTTFICYSKKEFVIYYFLYKCYLCRGSVHMATKLDKNSDDSSVLIFLIYFFSPHSIIIYSRGKFRNFDFKNPKFSFSSSPKIKTHSTVNPLIAELIWLFYSSGTWRRYPRIAATHALLCNTLPSKNPV